MSVLLTILLNLIVGVAGLVPGADIPRVNILTDGVTVSGVSAGCFMAVQMHVIYSLTIKGMACIAGGPFWCAQNNLGIALTDCMDNGLLIDIDYLESIMIDSEEFGDIDPLAGLASSRVWFYSGVNDSVVDRNVVIKNAALYSRFVGGADTIKIVLNVSSEHAQITNGYGNTCEFLGSPYINNCAFDAAGEQLQHLYNNTLIAPDGEVKGVLYEFDQGLFIGGGGWDSFWGLAQSAYIYIPNPCLVSSANGSRCRLHIAFHGCLQTLDNIGKQFILEAGYQSWADANNIIVLYPQSTSNTLNPNGCFDWWGYTGSAYASNIGVQVSVIKKIIDSLIDDGQTELQKLKN